VHGFHGVVEQRIEGLANEVKRAIGAPLSSAGRTTNHTGTMGSGAMGGNNAAMGMTGPTEGANANSGAPRAD
jgi:hypothetical protein